MAKYKAHHISELPAEELYLIIRDMDDRDLFDQLVASGHPDAASVVYAMREKVKHLRFADRSDRTVDAEGHNNGR